MKPGTWAQVNEFEKKKDGIGFMPGFSNRNPVFIIVICLALVVIGVTSMSGACRSICFPHQFAGGGGGDVLLRHAARGYRNRYH